MPECIFKQFGTPVGPSDHCRGNYSRNWPTKVIPRFTAYLNSCVRIRAEQINSTRTSRRIRSHHNDLFWRLRTVTTWRITTTTYRTTDHNYDSALRLGDAVCAPRRQQRSTDGQTAPDDTVIRDTWRSESTGRHRRTWHVTVRQHRTTPSHVTRDGQRAPDDTVIRDTWRSDSTGRHRRTWHVTVREHRTTPSYLTRDGQTATDDTVARDTWWSDSTGRHRHTWHVTVRQHRTTPSHVTRDGQTAPDDTVARDTWRSDSNGWHRRTWHVMVRQHRTTPSHAPEQVKARVGPQHHRGSHSGAASTCSTGNTCNRGPNVIKDVSTLRTTYLPHQRPNGLAECAPNCLKLNSGKF